MTRMSRDEKRAFLAGLHVGILGLEDPGSGPLLAPVWYDVAPGDQLWFTTDAGSRKGRLLEVGRRVSLVAQTETSPYTYVSTEGPVVSIRGASDEELLHMAVRYLGEERGTAYANSGGFEGQVTVHVAIERWLGVDYRKE
ncbi:MAG: pyridoxamine 5'-phosphate oxidase [Acidobacteria bacterium]|nr:MAG: pyridoxamine 5'-phosphate oxidase [Acidobacteriota bacterium]REK09644.1 MAG: pyridoxamine 5'-phosphate oxidase [Acidobacteriota bacterium]